MMPMHISCRQELSHGRLCRRVPVTSEGYCRWHARMQEFLETSPFLRQFWGWMIVVSLGAGMASAAAISLYHLAIAVDPARVARTVGEAAASIALLAGGFIGSGRREVVWIQVFHSAMTVMLVAVGVSLLGGAVATLRASASDGLAADRNETLLALAQWSKVIGLGVSSGLMFFVAFAVARRLRTQGWMQDVICCALALAMFAAQIADSVSVWRILVYVILIGWYFDLRYRWVRRMTRF